MKITEKNFDVLAAECIEGSISPRNLESFKELLLEEGTAFDQFVTLKEADDATIEAFSRMGKDFKWSPSREEKSLPTSCSTRLQVWGRAAGLAACVALAPLVIFGLASIYDSMPLLISAVGIAPLIFRRRR